MLPSKVTTAVRVDRHDGSEEREDDAEDEMFKTCVVTPSDRTRSNLTWKSWQLYVLPFKMNRILLRSYNIGFTLTMRIKNACILLRTELQLAVHQCVCDACIFFYIYFNCHAPHPTIKPKARGVRSPASVYRNAIASLRTLYRRRYTCLNPELNPFIWSACTD